MDNIILNQYVPYLEEQQILKKGDKEKILRETNLNKVSIASVLVKEKFVRAEDIETFLHEKLGVNVVDPLAIDIPSDIINLVDKQTAQKYKVIPVSFEVNTNTISLAVINPLDIILMDDLRLILGCRIKPLLALSYKIDEAFKKYYETQEGEKEEANIEDIIAEAASEDLEVVESRSEDDIDSLLHAAEETPTIKVTNLILTEAIKRRASDIFIEPWEKHMTVRCRVDGLLEEMKAPPQSMANSIVSRIKVMSNLDIAERRMPQDGRFKVKLQDRSVDIRVSVIPSSFGEKVCLRILDKKGQAQRLEKLGFASYELERIKDAATKPHGMILVTGPTGSGKTTTLYSVLAYLDSPEKNITTVEDPVEYQVFGINQVNIRENVGLTFPASLRSILRQDPDIIMVGEIRDYITMDIAIKAALTGHLVLSTLHTNDACGSIVRITNMGIEPFLIASSVLMVSAQRLIRRICHECREPYEPSEKLLQDLKIKPKKGLVFYKPVGCENCRKSGYFGRTVITEVLPITPNIRELIMRRETADAIKQMGRREGMTTLRESGINKVINGESTVDEVLRVTAADQAMK